MSRLGALNVREDKCDWKERKETVDVSGEGKFELFALIERKMKGYVKISGCMCEGVKEDEGCTEGVAVLLNHVWYCDGVELWCAHSRVTSVK